MENRGKRTVVLHCFKRTADIYHVKRTVFICHIKSYVLICIVLAACLMAAGCRKKGKEEVSADGVYVATFKEMYGDIDWLTGVTSSGSKVVMVGQSYDDETYGAAQKLIIIDAATGEQTARRLELGGDEYVNGIQAYKDGFIVQVDKYESLNGQKHIFVVYDKEFNEISRIPLDDIQRRAEKESGWFHLSNFRADYEGNIYFTNDSSLYVIDLEGKELCKIDLDIWVNQIEVTDDGRVIAVYYDDSYRVAYALVDLQNKKIGDVLSNVPRGRDNVSICPAGAGRFYVNSETALYVYDIGERTADKVLDWVNCDINANRISDFAALDGGAFAALSVYYDYSGNKQGNSIELAIIKEAPEGSLIKKNVTFVSFYPDYELNEKIIKFNRNSDKYRITVKNYVDDYYSYTEEAYTQFVSDIISGNAADFFIADAGISIENLAAKGALVDFKKLIEDDAELKIDDFIPNIMDALSTDGKVCGLGEAFIVHTLCGKTADVGGGRSWTVRDIQALMDKHPDAELMSDCTKSDVLRMMLFYSLGDFCNIETGECGFDSDDFASVLELCDRFPSEYIWSGGDDYISVPAKLRSGAVLLSVVYLSDFSEVQLYDRLYGEPVNFIGYPTSKGSGQIATFGNMFCINAKSKNIDGAWAFIRQFFLPEYQKGLDWGTPVLKEAFEARLEVAMEPVENEKDMHIWYYDDVEIKAGALSEEEAQTIRDIVYGVTSTFNTDMQLFTIITEEAEYYFRGQKTAKEVAGIIQSKAKLYIDESR